MNTIKEYVDFSDEIEHIQNIIDSAVDEEVTDIADLYELLDQLKLMNSKEESDNE
jgi:hypothetical protein